MSGASTDTHSTSSQAQRSQVRSLPLCCDSLSSSPLCATCTLREAGRPSKGRKSHASKSTGQSKSAVVAP